jgi:hypothetical protein
MGRLRDFDYDFWSIWHSERAREIREFIKRRNCWCPLANQAYSNMLASPVTMARVVAAMITQPKGGAVRE